MNKSLALYGLTLIAYVGGTACLAQAFSDPALNLGLSFAGGLLHAVSHLAYRAARPKAVQA